MEANLSLMYVISLFSVLIAFAFAAYLFLWVRCQKSTNARINEVAALIKEGVISGGMILKVECCTNAIRAGVRKVFIIDGRVPHALLIETLTDEGAGTMFKKEIEGNYVPRS